MEGSVLVHKREVCGGRNAQVFPRLSKFELIILRRASMFSEIFAGLSPAHRTRSHECISVPWLLSSLVFYWQIYSATYYSCCVGSSQDKVMIPNYTEIVEATKVQDARDPFHFYPQSPH